MHRMRVARATIVVLLLTGSLMGSAAALRGRAQLPTPRDDRRLVPEPASAR